MVIHIIMLSDPQQDTATELVQMSGTAHDKNTLIQPQLKYSFNTQLIRWLQK